MNVTDPDLTANYEKDEANNITGGFNGIINYINVPFSNVANEFFANIYFYKGCNLS